MDVSDTEGANDNLIAVTLPAGGASAGNNFVDERLGSIGDRVWEDKNFNGLQDPGELGIANVTVKLLDGANNTIGNTSTDSSGNYLFSNLSPGAYKVQVLAPSSSYFYTLQDAGSNANDAVDSDVDRNTGITSIINLAAGQNKPDVDAGLYRKASLGDRVWLDRDKDGIQDGTEIGVGKVDVNLLDSLGNIIHTTTTDALGNYLFTNVNPGTYTLEFNKTLAVTGGISVAKYPWANNPNAGPDDLDSDVTAVSGAPNFAKTGPIVLASGQDDPTWDAAITPIVIDLNGDGIHTISRANSQGTFDLLGTGKGIQSGWLSAEDGFLVVDRNGNGRVDDISEMFGGSSKGDGFSKLAGFDSNGDGVVDARDADFAQLKVWQDVNGNHQTDAGELLSLTDAGLVGLSVGYAELPFLDAQGNLHLERSSASLANGGVVDMTDVYFGISAGDASAAGLSLPSLAELMGNHTDLIVGSVSEQSDAAMVDVSDGTNAGSSADTGTMNSNEFDVQIVGQEARASFDFF